MSTTQHLPEVDLKQAAAHFAETMLRYLPDSHFAPTDNLILANISAELPLTGALAEWYSYLSPISDLTIQQLGNPCVVYASESLLEHQLGYRWQALPTGQRGPILKDWPASWVVVADIGADPIMVDTQIAECPVLMSMHGMGEWNPHLLAPSLAIYLEALSRWIESCLLRTGAATVNQMAASNLVWGEDGDYLPEIRTRLETALAPLLPPECLRWW